MIRMVCPSCSKKLPAKDELAGRTAREESSKGQEMSSTIAFLNNWTFSPYSSPFFPSLRPLS